MKAILSRAGLEILADVAETQVLLAFDFDGTLAPTVSDRDQAQLRARTRELFQRLCHLYPCAVITGRSRQDVRNRLGAAAVRRIVGNHGAEPSRGMRRFERQMATIKAHLQVALGSCRGLEIEDKQYSLALHYRRCAQKARAQRAIQAAISRLEQRLRVVPGKLVVNLLPADAPHKGDALFELWKQVGAQKALYVGDDVTDEDVFLSGGPRRLVSIRIGRSRSTAARYYLESQKAIDVLLARLCRLRSNRGGGGAD